MLEFLDRFPYLGANLLLLPVVLAGLVTLRVQWRAAVASGALFVPFAFASLAYVPDYWQPVRLFDVLRTGPEDVLLSFGTGVLVWLIAFGPLGRRIDVGCSRRQFLRRYVGVSVAGVGLANAIGLGGLSVAHGGLVSITVVGLFLLARRGDLWVCAIRGGLGFAAIYQVLLTFVFWCWPHLLGQWNLARLSGILVAGVPLEETAWSLTTGFTWTLFMGHALATQVASVREHPCAAPPRQYRAAAIRLPANRSA